MTARGAATSSSSSAEASGKDGDGAAPESPATRSQLLPEVAPPPTPGRHPIEVAPPVAGRRPKLSRVNARPPALGRRAAACPLPATACSQLLPRRWQRRASRLPAVRSEERKKEREE
uniref:Uncharacterized protein n=1 Tax=Oryza sativa subsp. japonica TaxID=39947 RepID=Q6ZF03_ORYSJ|nr:hypothetical protein [Oryza sativa Japonica Group]